MHVRSMHNVATGEKIKHKYLGKVTNINNTVFDKVKKRMRRRGLCRRFNPESLS